MFSLLILSHSFLSILVAASCECGFSVPSAIDPLHQVFTEYIETDFTTNTLSGWIAQNYSMTPELARGPYGKDAEVNNVVPSEQGLQLWVRRAIGDMIPMAEAATQRQDMLYGSFRIRAKMTGVNGTCGAFFWFRNNTQEIDMEFLSKQYNTTHSGLVNLVNQSPESEAAGYNAAGTAGYDIQPLPFPPDLDFHEYRFDWIPGQVSYYADDVLMRVFTENIPNSPGHMVLNHWSNGDPGWSAGPPLADTEITVSQVHLYFNSSDRKELQRFRKSCPRFDTSKVCEVKNNITIPLMPASSSTANSYVVPNPPAGPLQSKKKTDAYVIAGVVIGSIIILFILCMMSVRHWDTWRRKLRRTVGWNPVPSPDGDKEPHSRSPTDTRQRAS